MSEYVVNVTLKVKSDYNGAHGARQGVQNAINAGVREGLILSGTVNGEPELDARIQAGIAAASTATTPASA